MNKLLCPSCHHENELNAPVCVKCGFAFEDAAARTVEILTPKPQSLLPTDGTDPGVLVLYALDSQEPILVTIQPEIVLGRSAMGQSAATVDLSPFHGFQLGVSRQHAMLRCRSGSYTIEDLDSANGTWLNETPCTRGKEYPLRSTDSVRLGNLQMFIYFHTGKSIPEPVHQMHSLVVKTASADRITAQFLTDVIAPFCQAAEELQQIHSELQQTQHQPVQIDKVQYEAEVKVYLKQAAALNKLMKHKKVVRPVEEKEAALATNGAPSLQPDPKLEMETQQHASLASKWLREVKPNLTESEIVVYMVRVIPIVERILRSPLDI